MYRAIWRIKHNNKIYEPGDILTGLSDAQIKELLSMKAIEVQPSFNESEIQLEEVKIENGLTDEFAAFLNTLQAMKRPELLAYARKVNVEVDLKMKNTEICDLLLNDAKEKGVDIESLDDQSLKVFAAELGCDVSGEMNRDQLIVAIDAKLEEGNNE
ncbi:hypothetical protein NP92_02835 [Anoxybacillus gonensis]|uniref:Trigger factor n=1 Tax=Anoxybacillus gonensis TaxID=198467 RepID=A0AAW7THC0_9BACL|nr:hypothetical protein [Anoxybacillus gonensis]AKS37412.1 hypothetical protein AFK25_02405 [Anoxybacillus gonensis]KGP61350.1 hypothetical protein NP92_02835 [Anoxybacillus gonensis]MDO0876782.1 hypothetical protein [Anoxybacillus gonensis]